jgi:hypothetical protein
MNAIEMIEAAFEAEAKGVPVDYRAIVVGIYNGAKQEQAQAPAEPELVED